MRFQFSIIIIVFMLCAIATQSTSNYKNGHNHMKKKTTSQFNGVTWHKKKRKWYVQLRRVCGGYFKDELDAGKRVNQLCEELRIPHQNPQISAIPNLQYRKKEKTSQYKGVFWRKERGYWGAVINPKKTKTKVWWLF